MPAPTVFCAVCHKEVTKRSTISIDGKRVCREHDEAKEFLRKKEEEALAEKERKESAKRIEEALQKLARESLISTLRNFRALSMPQYEIILKRIGFAQGWEESDKIREEVESENIDPEAAKEDIQMGIAMYLNLQQEIRGEGVIER